jgi:hypothetical protein
MKTKLLSILVVFVLMVSLFSGCTNITPLTGGPAVNAMVTSNGGMSVKKGNYLYFVNGYKNSSNLVEGDNEYGNEQNAAIYRAELDSEGNLIKDEEGQLLNVELLIPKIVGFENGGLYIFDNYIFYASPHILKDRTGAVRFDLVDFYLANLDGSGVKKIYSTNEYSSSAEFSFYKTGNTVNLVVYDGSKIINVDITNGSVGNPLTMVNEATSVALPKVTEYNADNNVIADINQYIYYTRALNDSDNTILDLGNVLAKVEIGSNNEHVLVQDNVWTYSLDRVSNNSLYYNKEEQDSLNAKYYFRSLLEENFESAQETQLTGTNYPTVMPLSFESGNNRGVVATNDDNLVHILDILYQDGTQLIADNINNINLLLVNGNYAYYTYGDNNTLARINLSTQNIQNLTNEEDTFKVDMNVNVDIDNEYIYLYKEYTNDNGTSYYLERIQYLTTDFTSEFVGVFETEHMPDEEETATEEVTQ